MPAGGLSNAPKENSLYLELYVDARSAVVSTIAAGNNPNLLTAPPPLLGAVWRPRIDLSSVPGAHHTFVALSFTRLAGLPTPGGVLIVDPEDLMVPISEGSLDGHVFHIPLDSFFIGRQFYAQAGVLVPGEGVRLTNGLDLVTGTL